MKTFYTYLWLRSDGVPYYVGKGSGKRAFRKGSPSVDRIIIQEFPDEQSAFLAEIFLISFYGRLKDGNGPLRNQSDGGKGESGHPGAFTGKKFSEEHKNRISLALKGRKFSEETRRKISESWKRRPPVSRETGEKISAALTGRKRIFTPEHCAHLSLSYRKNR